jgi:putative acyl-CoA dehydrogenase
VLRALARRGGAREALEDFLHAGRGSDGRYDRFLRQLDADLGSAEGSELRARDLTQRIALAAQATLLLAHGPAASCEAFLASRIAAAPPAAFGTLPAGCDFEALMGRVLSA